MGLLLEAGVDRNAVNINGATALHVAALGMNRSEAAAAHLPVLRLLLQAGVDKALTDRSGRTALDCAFKSGYDNAEMVQLLAPESYFDFHFPPFG